MDNYCKRTEAFRINYLPDGTGRDTFKINNNGGFYKPYTPATALPVTSFVTRKSYSSPSPPLNARGFHYHSDGKGRDRYVEIDSGGLNKNFTVLSSSDAFRRSLRTNERSCSPYMKPGGRVSINGTPVLKTDPDVFAQA